jgi:uncharacterized Fe-S center protein
MGNLAFIRPNFIRRIVDYTKELGASPFLTDTNTLYAGTRGNSVSHLKTAIENGFAYAVVNAPIIIADGIMGASYEEVRMKRSLKQMRLSALPISKVTMCPDLEALLRTWAWVAHRERVNYSSIQDYPQK